MLLSLGRRTPATLPPSARRAFFIISKKQYQNEPDAP